MGEALRRDAKARGGRRRTIAHVLGVVAALLITRAEPAAPAHQNAPVRLDRGRFTVVAYPQDLTLARALLTSASERDTFPGLPRPRERVLLAIAPDAKRFREWSGPGAPEWGAAITIPSEHRIVLQGRRAGSDAGNPLLVLRHELAHLALHEALDDLPPRWFDEGYASYSAGEWGRDEVLATSVGLLLYGPPALDSLDAGFYAGAARADASYALAYRAVEEMASLDPERGLTLFFRYWKTSGSMDRALRQAYGTTQAAFEQRWRSRTLRRYGALALLANLSAALGISGLIVVPLYLLRRRRDRQRLAALRAADEAAERAARDSALDALLGSAPASETPPSAPPQSTPPQSSP